MRREIVIGTIQRYSHVLIVAGRADSEIMKIQAQVALRAAIGYFALAQREVDQGRKLRAVLRDDGEARCPAVGL